MGSWCTLDEAGNGYGAALLEGECFVQLNVT
jgi:hypothetical protein